MSPDLLDVLARAPGFGCTARGVVVSSAELLARIERLTSVFASTGLRSGDVVLHQGHQGPETLVAFWAAARLGAVFAPVDPEWPEPRCAAVAAQVRPVVVVSPAERHALWRSAAPSARLFVDGAAIPGDGASNPAVVAAPSPAAPAAYLCTSGSTGAPKVVVLSRFALAHSAQLALDTFGWRPGERLVNLPEPHTMSGLRNAVIAAPLGGLHWLCSPTPTRGNIFELVEWLTTSRAHRVVAAPILVRHLALVAARLEPDALGELRALYATGTDLSPDDVARFHARFGVPVLNYYGLTETAGLCIAQRLDGWSPRDESLGCAAGCELQVVDRDGRALPSGEVGELEVRTPQRMTGYLDDPIETAQRLRGEWLCTGDLARLDADGRVHLAGRADDFIKTHTTERLHPREIEAILEQHPAVAEAAVFLAPGAGGLPRLAARLVAEPGVERPTDTTLAAAVAGALGPARVPLDFAWVASLPRGSTGKLLRRALRAARDDDDPDDRRR